MTHSQLCCLRSHGRRVLNFGRIQKRAAVIVGRASAVKVPASPLCNYAQSNLLSLHGREDPTQGRDIRQGKTGFRLSALCIGAIKAATETQILQSQSSQPVLKALLHFHC